LRLRDRQRAAQAADFLVVAHHQVDRLAWLEAAADQHLDGFHLREQIALVVERATAPDETVLDFAAERVHRPRLLGPGCNGHHVLVRHQRDRLGRGVGARPRIQQRMLADDFLLQGGVDLGVLLFEVGVQLVEFSRVAGRIVQAGHSAELDRAGQPLGGCGQVDLQRRRRRHGNLPRRRAPGIDRYRCHQCSEHQYQRKEHTFQHGSHRATGVAFIS